MLIYRFLFIYFYNFRRVVSEIGPGLLVLVGIHESDTDSDADYM